MVPRRSSLLACLSTVVLAATVLIGAAPAEAATTKFVDIPGDGVTLKANVTTPATAGSYPAVVFPSSWGLNDLEYVAQAKAMAENGYVVVSYTPRGWWASGGEIDTAGPKDLADLSKVLDWTLANTPADPARLGTAGVSYGAGISLLGAAFDKRIRAVAMLSGWTDLNYSLYSDQTRHLQSAGLLSLAAQLVGHPGAELTTMLSDFNANRNIAKVMDWAKVRSPATYLDRINANGPAVLIANAWGDTFFPPNQLTDFYAKLTTPKRLELRPGDHAIAELTGLAGLPNDVWTSTRGWFDRYLKSDSTGTAPGKVYLKPDNAAAETWNSWGEQTTSTKRYGLGAIRWYDGTGLLGGSPSSGWSKTLPNDLDTVADGGVVLLTNGISAFTGLRPTIWLPFVDRARAGVWAAERPSSTLKVRGIPKLHVNLTGTAANGSVVAYLYDLDSLGNAALLTHNPVTWLTGTAGSRSADVSLSAVNYDLPAGHSLTLVVDTVDPLYYDANGAGTVTVTGGSYLDLPVK
ncbi:CocE/NonD family hydrolase [Actinoplanes sp. NPDC026619]|uniref:CocE/NonD family hydrolase n=1 Tax=Actinoplanes sp. NPDC026619 TaxID=3155798 RepID=UPI0033F9792C